MTYPEIQCKPKSTALQVFEGKALATFKLHLAAIHLPDQVRACGAGAFSLEFWVERMMQHLKRMIKYRSTAYPELLFVHDWLLTLACRRVRRTEEGKHLRTVQEKHEDLKAAKRKSHDSPEDDGTMLLGATRGTTEEEEAIVLPEYQVPAPHESTADQLAGLPKLLHDDPDLDQRGWPTFKADQGESRVKWLYSELGLGGPFEAPQEVGAPPPVKVHLKKYTRAQLPTEECVSSVQCRAQWKKNNQWGLVVWQVDGGNGNEEDGRDVTTELCAVQFQYFILAEYSSRYGRRARHGTGVQGAVPPEAEALRLGVAHVFKVQAVHVAGMVAVDELTEDQHDDLPEFFHLQDCTASAANPAFCGSWVLDLKTIDSQLVATKERGCRRKFMISSRASGRQVSVIR